MRKFQDLSYYEILEIPPSATSYEIREAYREALSVYNDDSLATYSLFPDEERDEILKTVEEAFRTLIDERRRADYDKKLVDAGRMKEEESRESQYAPLPVNNRALLSQAITQAVRRQIEEKEVKGLTEEIFSKESISGADLKRLREAIGIGLEELFEITRISVTTLNAIEADHADKLPPMIYLRNFLAQYAEVLQLDPSRIVEGYTTNMLLKID